MGWIFKIEDNLPNMCWIFKIEDTTQINPLRRISATIENEFVEDLYCFRILGATSSHKRRISVMRNKG